MTFAEITLRLPERLATWLYEFSKQIGMTPDQFIATILEYYYDAWLVGRSSVMKNVAKVSERDYCVNTDRYLVFAERKKFVREFVDWVCRNNLELDENAIEKYIEEYVKEKELERETVYYYKKLLKSFVRRLRMLNVVS